MDKIQGEILYVKISILILTVKLVMSYHVFSMYTFRKTHSPVVLMLPVGETISCSD